MPKLGLLKETEVRDKAHKSRGTVIVGADHSGFALKEGILAQLEARGWTAIDLTPIFEPGDDYPPIAKAMARRVLSTQHLGILCCGSGNGMVGAANRAGARAILGATKVGVILGRQDFHANIIAFGEKTTSKRMVMGLINLFLTSPVSTEERHLRRIRLVEEL